MLIFFYGHEINHKYLMLRRMYLLVFTLCFIAWSGRNDAVKAETSTLPSLHNVEHIASGLNEFGYKLTLELMKQNNSSNTVLSPTGVGGLLAMTLLGSVGRTYDELAATIGFPQDILTNRANHEHLGKLIKQLNSAEGSSRTSYANAIFIDEHTRIRNMYRNYLSRVYQGDALPAKFSDNLETKNVINEWIKNNTNGKIEDFLKEPLPIQTKVVLLSALYFNGQWLNPFISSRTAKMSFQTPTENVMADLMLNFGKFSYISSTAEDMHMIALPYIDNATIMYVLKPRVPKRLSLQDLMTRLNYTTINQLILQMNESDVVIRLPKMEIKSVMHLEDSLKAMGLTAMFNPVDAHFGLMIDGSQDNNTAEDELITRIERTDREQDIKTAVSRLVNPGVHVDTVLQDVKININEIGTEAVAGTGGFLARSALQFYADSPFFMFIRNEKTKLITFSAVIYDPTV